METTKVTNKQSEKAAKVFDFSAISNDATEFDDIVAKLCNNANCKLYEDIRIRSCNLIVDTNADHTQSEIDRNTFLSISLATPVVALDADGNGIPTKNITCSWYSLNAAMKNNDRLSLFRNRVRTNPDMMPMLLNGGSVSIIAEFVPSGTVYVNPFSTSGKESVYGDDKMIYHFVRFTEGRLANDLFGAMLTSMFK